jgi:cell division protein FtsQ
MPRVAGGPGGGRGPARKPIDRPARWKVLVRRQRRLLRPLLLLTLIGVAVLGFVGMVQSLGRGRNFHEEFGQATARLGLRVRQVLVEGRQKTPDALLRAALGVDRGDPLLTFSLADARARIESIRWVQSASIERRLPDTILVLLKERRPFAVWQHDGRYVLIDRAGETVTDSDVATFANDLPLVVGVGAPAAAAALIDALATQPALQARVVAAVRVGERRWNLRMRNGMDVLLPEAALPQALAKLAELDAAHKLLDRPLEAIDLRLPDRLVIRTTEDPPRDATKPGPRVPLPSGNPALRRPA